MRCHKNQDDTSVTTASVCDESRSMMLMSRRCAPRSSIDKPRCAPGRCGDEAAARPGREGTGPSDRRAVCAAGAARRAASRGAHQRGRRGRPPPSTGRSGLLAVRVAAAASRCTRWRRRSEWSAHRCRVVVLVMCVGGRSAAMGACACWAGGRMAAPTAGAVRLAQGGSIVRVRPKRRGGGAARRRAWPWRRAPWVVVGEGERRAGVGQRSPSTCRRRGATSPRRRPPRSVAPADASRRAPGIRVRRARVKVRKARLLRLRLVALVVEAARLVVSRHVLVRDRVVVRRSAGGLAGAEDGDVRAILWNRR